MNRLVAALTGAVALAIALPAQAVEPFYSKTLDKGWLCGCYAGDKAAFSHCALGTTFRANTERQRQTLRASKMYFEMSVYDRMQAWSFVLASKDWSLIAGKSYEILFRFRNGHAYRFNADAVEADGDVGLFGMAKINPDAVADFMLADGFQIEINGKLLGGFSLSGSAAAIKHLFGVTAQYSGRGSETFPSADTF